MKRSISGLLKAERKDQLPADQETNPLTSLQSVLVLQQLSGEICIGVVGACQMYHLGIGVDG